MTTVDLNALVARVQTSPQQRRNANYIVSEFALAGYSPAIALAALANAWEESRWQNDAWGDNGASGGLFQLNTAAGAGRGMTKAQIESPVLNTRRIIKEVQDYGRHLLWQSTTSVPVAELAGTFARDIERPADPALAASRRKQKMHELFPTVASLPANTLRWPITARAAAVAARQDP